MLVLTFALGINTFHFSSLVILLHNSVFDFPSFLFTVISLIIKSKCTILINNYGMHGEIY